VLDDSLVSSIVEWDLSILLSQSMTPEEASWWRGAHRLGQVRVCTSHFIPSH
jgi:hypothetical protein